MGKDQKSLLKIFRKFCETIVMARLMTCYVWQWVMAWVVTWSPKLLGPLWYDNCSSPDDSLGLKMIHHEGSLSKDWFLDSLLLRQWVYTMTHFIYQKESCVGLITTGVNYLVTYCHKNESTLWLIMSDNESLPLVAW